MSEENSSAPETHPGETVASLISAGLNELTPAERRVARTLLAGYPTAGLESITMFASAADVSPPTVMRFVEALGFASYGALQARLREETQARLDSALAFYDQHLGDAADGGDSAGSVHKHLKAFHSGLDATLSKLEPGRLKNAIDTLADPRRYVACTGGRYSQSLALYLHSCLHAVRKNTEFVGYGPIPRVDQLLDITRRYVLVVFDFRRYQEDTEALAKYAREHGATVLLITDQWLSPVVRVAHQVLTCSVRSSSPLDSQVAATALVETLVTGVIEQLGERGRERMEATERLYAQVNSRQAVPGTGPITLPTPLPGDTTAPRQPSRRRRKNTDEEVGT